MNKFRVFAVFTLFVSATSVYAECSVSDATITQVSKYRDGNVFVYFDKQTSCNCSIKDRMAFMASSESFLASSVLTAFAAQKKVSLIGDDVGCPVHGNTAKILDFNVVR